jgi:ABC-2 type transport system ATP-binding protein
LARVPFVVPENQRTPSTPLESPARHGSTILTVHNLTVTYGERPALSNVSVEVPAGATGLLGANGAGKSTLIRAILGFVPPDSGWVEVLGVKVRDDPLEVRSRIGYVPEQDAYIPGLDAVASVAYCGELGGLFPDDAMQRAHDVLTYVGLGEARYRDTETFSTGMKQRLKLAQALVHDPDLLLLDEPTNGMDPKGRDEMLALINDLTHRHRLNVLFSSHLLPDIERTCDYVVMLRQGVVAGAGQIDELRCRAHRIYEVRIRGEEPAFVSALRAAGFACHATDDGLVTVDLADGKTQAVFALAARTGAQIRHLRPQMATLEDVFVELTADPANDRDERGSTARTADV